MNKIALITCLLTINIMQASVPPIKVPKARMRAQNLSTVMESGLSDFGSPVQTDRSSAQADEKEKAEKLPPIKNIALAKAQSVEPVQMKRTNKSATQCSGISKGSLSSWKPLTHPFDKLGDRLMRLERSLTFNKAFSKSGKKV